MKGKVFIFITLIISLFIFNDSVSASSVGSITFDNTFFDDYIKPLSSYSSDTYDIDYIRTQVIEALDIDYETEDYLLVLCNNILHGYKWSKTNEFSYYPGITFGNYSSYLYLYFAFENISSNDKTITHAEYSFTNSALVSLSYEYNSSTIHSNARIVNGGSVSKGIYQNNGTKKVTYFESSFDITISDYGFSSSYYEPVKVCEDDICNEYYVGDTLFDKNGIASWVKKTPTINISKKNEELTENNEKISETININFSIFDTDKYLYFYSTSTGDIKTWVDILENDYEYSSYSNGTLYLAVIDKAKYIESAENGEDLVFDYITTSTYEFANIVDLVPDFRFETEIPDSCYLAIGGKQEIVCKKVEIDILNYYDFEKYLVIYSEDLINYTTIYSNQFTKVFSGNSTIYLQILNRTTNEYIKYMTYTLSGISTNMSSIGPYISLKGKYNEEKYLYEVTSYFYNYDSSLYNYYYSTDRENWTEIGQFEPNIYSGADSSAIYYKTFEIYEDCTFYIKIEDKEGNYIYSTTMTIKFREEEQEQISKSFFSYVKDAFENFIKDIKQIFSFVTKFYNGLPDILQSFYILCFFFVLAYLFIKFLL